MPAAIAVPRSAMPGYKNSDLTEAQTLSSDYSYAQTSVSNPSGMFCFSQTEPSADLLNGPSWATSEGTQNFPDFADNVSSHSGEAEEYIVTSGHNTPRGSIHMSRTRTNGGSWAPTGLPQVSAGGHAMSRVDSSRSTGSMLSHSSHPSNMDVAGNGSAFRHGSQVAPGNIVGADPYLMMESEASTLAQGYWPAYHLPSGLDMDNAPFPVAEAAPMHVVPSQMQFGPDTTLADHTSPTSWQNFPAPGTRTSSPATIDDTWLHPQGPISPPNSSPEIPCQSPSMDFGSHMNGSGMPSLPEGMALASPMSSRREGESARNHDLYKNVKPHEDGLFHCPFEGRDDCQHKPEKLKCNYDKYVDSHLKPYRCKDPVCENAKFSSTACLLRHEREAHGLHGHGDKPFLCAYEGCERGVPGNGFPRQWNLKDHMKRVHNDHGSSTGGSPSSGNNNNGLGNNSASNNQQPPAAKGRKRKTDSSSDHQAAPTSRKSAQKSMPVVKEEPQQARAVSKKPLIEQWIESRNRVQEMVRDLSNPADMRTIQQINEIQGTLANLTRMAAELNPHHVHMMTSG